MHRPRDMCADRKTATLVVLFLAPFLDFMPGGLTCDRLFPVGPIYVSPLPLYRSGFASVAVQMDGLCKRAIYNV